VVIIAVVAGIFLWQVLVPALVAQGLNRVGLAQALALPVANGFILAGLVVLVQQDVPMVERRVLWALLAGLGLMVVADAVTGTAQAYGRPVAPALRAWPSWPRAGCRWPWPGRRAKLALKAAEPAEFSPGCGPIWSTAVVLVVLALLAPGMGPHRRAGMPLARAR
jgi:hypothetical protein